MPNIRVCALFRPLNSKEKADHGDTVSFRAIDSETFVFKDEKEEEIQFCFDRVFCEGSEQGHIYEFLGLPIVKGVVSGVNGAIITYGQVRGRLTVWRDRILERCNEKKKGLLPRVVDGLFNAVKQSDEISKCTMKLSMVEVYMERVRDLFDLSKDNLPIKESKVQGIFVSGATEIPISDPADALQNLARGIANRAVGETRINEYRNEYGQQQKSLHVHILCPAGTKEGEKVIIAKFNCFTWEITSFICTQKEKRSGKLILVDLAGSEKAEKTGAEGRVLEEAKTINKSLSALGNVINALTCESPGRANHIPYRDSKLTRILQDALGGKSQTALLCCCSPSPSDASESLSSLRFGARAKHIKALPHANIKDEDTNNPEDVPTTKNEACERILEKLSQRLKPEDVQLLEQLFIVEGIFFDPYSVEEMESAYDDVTARTISLLQKTVEELIATIDRLKKENQVLKCLTRRY